MSDHSFMTSFGFTVTVPGASVEDVFEYVCNWPAFLAEWNGIMERVTVTTPGTLGTVPLSLTPTLPLSPRFSPFHPNPKPHLAVCLVCHHVCWFSSCFFPFRIYVCCFYRAREAGGHSLVCVPCLSGRDRSWS